MWRSNDKRNVQRLRDSSCSSVLSCKRKVRALTPVTTVQ